MSVFLLLGYELMHSLSFRFFSSILPLANSVPFLSGFSLPSLSSSLSFFHLITIPGQVSIGADVITGSEVTDRYPAISKTGFEVRDDPVGS